MGKITDALKKAEQERRERAAQKSAAKHEARGSHHLLSNWFGLKKQTYPKSFDQKRIQRRGLTQQRYLATIIDESGIDPRIVSYYDTDSYVAEQYRTFRTNLLSLQEAKKIKTCLFTSALHAEGKSISSLNLAVSYSELSSKKVLLIDADLHKPALHYYMNIPSGEGLADLLQRDMPIETVLKTTHVPNLTFLPSGTLPERPSDILGSRKMGHLLEKLKTQFDIIIIDTPPVLTLSDAGVLGTMCDATFLVVKVGKTNRESVDRAVKLLKNAHVEVEGLVLTNIEYYIPTYIYKYL